MAVIDHLVYAVPELDAAIDEVERRTGVRPARGGAHTGMGTHNALASLGDCYLEVIAPDPDQPEPAQPRPFGIDSLTGAALVTFAVRPDDDDDIDALVARADAAGHHAGAIVDMSRTTTDGDVLRWRLTFPQPMLDGLVPFVIDWGDTPQPSETTPGGLRLASLSAAHPTPAVVADAHRALGLRRLTVEPGAAALLRAVLSGPAGSMTLDKLG